MGTNLDDTLSVSILVASIQVAELAPGKAAIKTSAELDLKWESVSSQLIEEIKTLTFGTVSVKSSAASSANVCGFCSSPGHHTKDYFFNPLNLKNQITND